MNRIGTIIKNRYFIMLLTLITVIAVTAVSAAVFTDRVNRTGTIQTAIWGITDYSIQRTASEGYFTPGETFEVTLQESNSSSTSQITSQITMSAAWDSPIAGIFPWGNDSSDNIEISIDGDPVSYSVNSDQTITFHLPEKDIPQDTDEVERTLQILIPADLAATGQFKFSFNEITLTTDKLSDTYQDPLNELDFRVGVAWNISRNKTTALGNPNRDVLALLTENTKANNPGLQIIKYGSSNNTNLGEMQDWNEAGSPPWSDYHISSLSIAEGVTTMGDYAFASETGIAEVIIPTTVTDIGRNTFDSTGLSGTLSIPAAVKNIDARAFGNLPDINVITFGHSAEDPLTLPDNQSEGKKTDGAFYVPTYVETEINSENSIIQNQYKWHNDNRRPMPVLAEKDTWYSQGGTTIARSSISSIELKDTYHPNIRTVADQWDASIYSTGADDDSGSVTAYLEDDGAGKNTYKLTIAGNGYGRIMANEDSSYVFANAADTASGFNSATAISGLDKLDTRNATTMAGMFHTATSVVALDIGMWNTENVTSFHQMFYSCRALKNLDLETKIVDEGTSSYVAWDTGRVTTMTTMFRGCTNLESLDVSSWNTSAVTNMSQMFRNLQKVENLNITSKTMDKLGPNHTSYESWTTTRVTNMSYMFSNCKVLSELDVSGLETNQVTNTGNMFDSCTSLASVDISGWDMSLVTSSNKMLYGTAISELTLPGTLKKIGNSFAANCTKLRTIRFLHDTNTAITFPTAGSTSGAFYVPNYLKTTFDFNGNTSAANYDWITDNREPRPPEPATLAKTETWYTQGGTSILRTKITSIAIVDTYDPSEKAIVDQWDASTESTGADDDEGPITAYIEEDNSGSGTYQLTIAGNGYGKIFANPDSSYAFSTYGGSSYFNAAASFTGLELLDTSNATAMANMFNNMSSVTSLDIGGWDTSNVTNMANMFSSCSSLTSLDIQNWNISKVTNISAMFKLCAQLTTLDLETHVVNKGLPTEYIAWDTGSVTNMAGLFTNCQRIIDLNISNWDTSSVTTLGSIFSGLGQYSGSTTNLDIKTKAATVNGKTYTAWDTSSVKTMSGMFYACTFSNFDISNWNTSSVTTMSEMFNGFNGPSTLDLTTKQVTVNGQTYTAWDTQKVTTIYRMFKSYNELTTLKISNWNTSNVTNMSEAFYYANGLTSLDVNTKQATVNGQAYIAWDTVKVTNMSSAFTNCLSLTSLDISNWNTTKVTTMGNLLNVCSSLTSFSAPTKSVTIGGKTYTAWDTSAAKTMTYMFGSCSKLKTLNVSGWNTSAASSLQGFGDKCTSLTSITLGADFGQSANVNNKEVFKLAAPYSTSNLLKTTVSGANSVMRSYNWAGDFRSATFVNPTAVLSFSLDFDPNTGAITGYQEN